MRRILPLAAVSLLVTIPLAQASSTHHRMTFHERFEKANTTHDGHLTQAQAKAGHMFAVARHFALIDTGHKGYVTEADIHAYYKALRAAHRRAHEAARAKAGAKAGASG